MPIEPGQFMLYWALGLLAFVAFIFRRPRRRGMRLRLLGGRTTYRNVIKRESTFTDRIERPATERSLNVIFQFNGHSWDAYEVLGLAAGTNYDSVRAAYEEALSTVDPTSRPFLEAAFRAITEHLEGSV